MSVCKLIVHAKTQMEYYRESELIANFGKIGNSDFTRKTQMDIT